MKHDEHWLTARQDCGRKCDITFPVLFSRGRQGFPAWNFVSFLISHLYICQSNTCVQDRSHCLSVQGSHKSSMLHLAAFGCRPSTMRQLAEQLDSRGQKYALVYACSTEGLASPSIQSLAKDYACIQCRLGDPRFNLHHQVLLAMRSH